MTSELWNDLTGLDRVHAILTAKQPKNTGKKPRVRRKNCESLEAYAWRKQVLKHGISTATEDDTPYTFDPLPGLVTVLRRSLISLCHLCFERQRADATQI